MSWDGPQMADKCSVALGTPSTVLENISGVYLMKVIERVPRIWNAVIKAEKYGYFEESNSI